MRGAAARALRERAFERQGDLYVPSRPRLEVVRPELGALPRLDRGVLRYPAGAVSSSIAAPRGGPAPPNVTGLRYFVVVTQNQTLAGNRSGTGDSFAKTSGTVTTLTDAAGAFVAIDDRQRITIAGATSPGNNGNFWVTNTVAITSTTLPMLNSAGVAEAYSGTWTTQGRITQLVDLFAGIPFSSATNTVQPRAITDLAPGLSLWAWSPEGSWTGTLLYVDTPFAALFQSTPVSFSCRYRRDSGNASIILGRWCQNTLSAQSLQFGFGTTTTATCSINDGTATNLSATIPAYPTGSWFTAGWRLDRSPSFTVSYYQNGVFVATSAAGTARTPTGFLQTNIGPNTSGAGSLTSYAGGFAAANAAWSDAEFLAVHNAFLSYGIP